MGLNKKLFIQADTGVVNTENFAPVLYTGNGSTQSISSLDFQPDLVWIKNRSSASYNHNFQDTLRGTSSYLTTASTSNEITVTNCITSFDSNGFTIGNNGAVNNNTDDYVAWCWKAGGAAVSNTNGDIASSVSANTDAGFSIVSYTGNSSYGQTVGHGLNSAPELVIIKNRDNARNWRTYAEPLGATKYINLDESAAAGTYGSFNNTAPTPTVFSTTSADADRATNYSGDKFIAYCFHSVDGYQKIGSYTGTGSTGNAITGVGFQPRFLMMKRTDASGGSWLIVDSQRTDSGGKSELFANTTTAESGSGYNIVFDSDGFTLNTTTVNANASSGTYIYLAIA